MARIAGKPNTASAGAKKRGRKKLEISLEAQKKLDEINSKAAKEKDLILAAERSKAVKTTLDDIVSKLQAIGTAEGKVKLTTAAGKVFFLKSVNIKLDLRDENGKLVKAGLETIANR